jgi:hypothetical protein
MMVHLKRAPDQEAMHRPPEATKREDPEKP